MSDINYSAYPNPPREQHCDLPECLSCGQQDSDLERCVVPECDAMLHDRCGTTCNACGKAVCTAHFLVIEDLNICHVCAMAVVEQMAKGN
jgi:hypothetical protein